MSSRGLPPRPNLEQYKKQAKDLVKSLSAADPDALKRVRMFHPHSPDGAFKLADAQLTIAREHDFETWPQFAAHVQTSRPASVEERISVGDVELGAYISGLENARGIVLFPMASGSLRFHPSYRYLAQKLHGGGIGTILADLLTEDEELRDPGEFQTDIQLLGKRAAAMTAGIARDARFRGLPLGIFSSGTGAAAAIFAITGHPGLVRAVVFASGRPDLAGPWMGRVQAPTLFVVGSKDTVALGFTQSLLAPMPNLVNRTLAVIEGAHHVCEDPDALDKTAALALDWFRRYLAD
jgi:pimeloyl-ACP methyl ester carboxylesterase